MSNTPFNHIVVLHKSTELDHYAKEQKNHLLY